jgi:Domain of unknown function (DUF4326)
MTLIKILNGTKQYANFQERTKQYANFQGMAVWCDRRSALGNPFELCGEESRDAVCEAYAQYFGDVVFCDLDPANSADWWAKRFGLNLAKAWKAPSKEVFMAELARLERVALSVSLKKGGTLGLGCWCAPKRCHCDTISAYLRGKLGMTIENVKQGSLF